MDKLAAIETFLRVAELESFTQAADALDLPKASVTARVQALESLLNVKLLHRTTRRVQLTSEGAEFVARGQALLNNVEEAESMFRKDTQIAGKIRVDMIIPLARDRVIPQLAKFLEKYPQIEVEFSGTDHRVDLIRDGIDVVVRGGNHRAKGVVEEVIGQNRVVNVASPAYLKKFGTPKNLADLKNHRLVYYVSVLGAKPEGFEYFDGEKYRDIKMPGIITVNSIDAYKAAAVAGLGIIQNPVIGVAPEMARGQLIEVLSKFRAEAMTIKLVYREQKMLPQRVRVFLDWLKPILGVYVAE